MTDITLKPGKNSTEFIGKVILQAIIIVNLGLKFFKLPAIDLSPEETLAIAGGIEAVWMIFRQWNKRLELSSKTALIAGDKALTLESYKADMKLKELQMRHDHEMEKVKAINGMNPLLEKLAAAFDKAGDLHVAGKEQPNDPSKS